MRSFLNLIEHILSPFAREESLSTSDRSTTERSPREVVSVRRNSHGRMVVLRGDGSREVWKESKEGQWIRADTT